MQLVISSCTHFVPRETSVNAIQDNQKDQQRTLGFGDTVQKVCIQLNSIPNTNMKILIYTALHTRRCGVAQYTQYTTVYSIESGNGWSSHSHTGMVPSLDHTGSQVFIIDEYPHEVTPRTTQTFFTYLLCYRYLENEWSEHKFGRVTYVCKYI